MLTEPSRAGVVARHGGPVKWFEASPTFVLHFLNAYEDGDENCVRKLLLRFIIIAAEDCGLVTSSSLAMFHLLINFIRNL